MHKTDGLGELSATDKIHSKGKVIPLQARFGPEGG